MNKMGGGDEDKLIRKNKTKQNPKMTKECMVFGRQ